MKVMIQHPRRGTPFTPQANVAPQSVNNTMPAGTPAKKDFLDGYGSNYGYGYPYSYYPFYQNCYSWGGCRYYC